MAYADGELRGADLEAFEERLAKDSSLGQEVAELQALNLVARVEVPLEPADHEWRRIDEDLVHQSGLGLGWILFIAATLALSGQAVFSISQDESLSVLTRSLSIAGISGLVLLAGLTLRERLRVLPFDPYRQIKR
ncbi:MAG: hypothetical protein ACI8QC_000419 [Planctomycetota bacterium]|jgi:hypothetical protein